MTKIIKKEIDEAIVTKKYTISNTPRHDLTLQILKLLLSYIKYRNETILLLYL